MNAQQVATSTTVVALANPIALAGVLGVVLATVAIGAGGQRVARTTSDLLVASRAVHPRLNALAICGEYLSAGTYLGLATLVFVFGVDMLWYPVGFTMGYLLVLAFVAAPMRRFGAYTIPDFAAARLGEPWIRKLAGVFVLVICWLYLLPQMKGAGIVLQSLTGAPYWVGVVVVGAVVTANVAFGGMRSITYVQAFHYFVKAAAISLCALALLAAWQLGSGRALSAEGRLRFQQVTTVAVDVDTAVKVSEATAVRAVGSVDGVEVNGLLTLQPGTHDVGASTELSFDDGAAVPVRADLPSSDNDRWSRPQNDSDPTQQHRTYWVYSLIVATFLGTMGLPHIVVRFYTNPDGGAARRTTLAVIVLLGFYYVFPPLYGVLGRGYAPDLLLTGDTDALVLALPGRLVSGVIGDVLVAVLACGAFAAFISTSSGLLVTIASSLSHDLTDGRAERFRAAAVVGGAVAVMLGLIVQPFGINVLVGWAFAIAASAFCPVVLLGVWWRRLTARGAVAGMVVGGGLSAAAVATTMANRDLSGWTAALLAQPAAWTVPTAFIVSISVSLCTHRSVPTTTTSMFVSMHLPESLGVGRPLRP
jgi:Na+(H+)/acetate symporter ActP